MLYFTTFLHIIISVDMIKNIIFDMGGILLDFNREYFLDSFNVLGEDRKILYKEVFEGPEWPLMDLGELDEQEAYDSIIKRIPVSLHKKAYDLIFNWDKVVKPIEGMEDLIKDLKLRGYKIYLLSNASRRALNEYWPTVKGHEYFDGKVVSAFVNMVKPNDGIYQYLLNEFKLKPEESVFIDDLKANVEGAIRNNINGIIFDGSIDKLKNELEKLLKE